MTDDHLIIGIASTEASPECNVTSQVIRGSSGPNSTLVRIVSTCGGLVHEHHIKVWHAPGYTQEQMDYDIEQARFKSAQKVAGRMQVSSLLQTTISTVSPGSARKIWTPEKSAPAVPP